MHNQIENEKKKEHHNTNSSCCGESAHESENEEQGVAVSYGGGKDSRLANAILIGSGVISVAILAYAASIAYTKGGSDAGRAAQTASIVQNRSQLEEQVVPSAGVVLPLKWGEMGSKLTQSGVLDAQKLKALYAGRGGMSAEMNQLLDGTYKGDLKITPDNSAYLLNLLWAVGLGQKSPVLDNGPMKDPKYGGAGRFASTGGWSLAADDAMSHYSRHAFVNLTSEQKALVEKVSQGIYRPCCGNSTYFPDCNHGMAMLGLLELLASQGVSEADMYKAALAVNSYWFPDTYLSAAQLLKAQGQDWSSVDAKIILGSSYSSGSGARNVQTQLSQIQSQNQQPSQQEAVQQPRSSGGCGV